MLLAHSGHWLANLIYLAPVLLVGLGLAWASVTDRGTDPDDFEEPRS